MKRYDIVIPMVSLVWAGSFIAVKMGLDEMSPVEIAFFRFAVASPFMFLLLLIKKKPLVIPAREFPSIIVLALTGVTLLYLFQFTGIKYTTAATSAMLINTNVIFIAMLSFAFLGEKLSARKTGGIFLGFAGVAVIFGNSIFDLTASLEGNMFIILSAVCWAVYSVVGKKILERYDALTVTTYVFILGTLFLVPFLEKGAFVTGISIGGWAIIFYLALLCSVFGYVAWYDALSGADATRVAIFLNLIPLFAMFLSYIVLGERITPFLAAGAILIIYGIYLTERG
ncbi:MAG TPA: DMT family transporter [Thermoplasmatales archaeon]|nr:DMT family transporter [Thermoplasmatales archaeon]